MATVYRRPSARRDLIAHYIYLAANAGDATADRFLSKTAYFSDRGRSFQSDRGR